MAKKKTRRLVEKKKPVSIGRMILKIFLCFIGIMFIVLGVYGLTYVQTLRESYNEGTIRDPQDVNSFEDFFAAIIVFMTATTAVVAVINTVYYMLITISIVFIVIGLILFLVGWFIRSS